RANRCSCGSRRRSCGARSSDCRFEGEDGFGIHLGPSTSFTRRKAPMGQFSRFAVVTIELVMRRPPAIFRKQQQTLKGSADHGSYDATNQPAVIASSTIRPRPPASGRETRHVAHRFKYVGFFFMPKPKLLLHRKSRQHWYTRVQAALALPTGLERVAALHAAKIRDDKKH